MKLLNPSDAELNAAFAEKVCGWKNITGYYDFAWKDELNSTLYRPNGVCFTTSAAAVLPWLEKCPCAKASFSPSYRQKKMLWEVSCGVDNPDNTMSEGSSLDTSFPRAAVTALLRAHGVEVEFTQ